MKITPAIADSCFIVPCAEDQKKQHHGVYDVLYWKIAT